MTHLALDDTLLGDAVQGRLQTLGPYLQTLQLSPRSTIVPPELGETAGRRAIEQLGPAHALRDEIELKDTIGEGGMGIVHSGTQRSLGRTVAIKTLRAEHRQPRDVLTLLREAWVTGALEHPNILPIYDVKLDEGGMPLVVLKRIDGVDWGEMLHDVEQMRERFGEGDLLEHNLEVFMQVCHAVAFAHSRGFVHRDIKPDNVRIGAFGEVYVLDWGIAVALEDDGTGRFPLAAHATAMAGTPSYMAPEMLGGDDAEPITERTDIYLLGASLCEIATGKPPHDGPTAVALVTSVLQSKPDLSGVPEELAQIIRGCMHIDPNERFENAEAVRTAIKRFLDHRGSDKLAKQANTRLDELKSLVREGHDDVRVAAHDLLGACRAGFSAALDMWTDNLDAQRGLRSAVELMVDYELRRGDARAASNLLEQLTSPPELLQKRVRRGLAKQREQEERREELEALGKELDPKTGTKTRAFVSVLLGIMWCVLPLVGLFGFNSNNYQVQLSMTSAAFVVCLGLFYWARDSLTKTAYNRRLAGVVFLTLAATAALIGGGALIGIDERQVTNLYLLVWGMSAWVTTITMEPKLWPAAVTYTALFFVSAIWVDARFYLMALCNAVLTVNFAVAWRPRDLTPPSSNVSSHS